MPEFTDNIYRAINEIPNILKYSNKYNHTISSYGLKHKLSSYRNGLIDYKIQTSEMNSYISNDDFKIAMKFLNFKSKIDSNFGLQNEIYKIKIIK
jgi:hypothetical protein